MTKKNPTKQTKANGGGVLARPRLKKPPPATDDVVIVGFNYSLVSSEDAEKLKAAATSIHKSAEHILDIGRELRACRDDCFSGGQGKNAGIWGAWLVGEFGMDRRTALRYINATDLVGRLDIMSKLKPTCLYMLAAPSTPPTAVHEVTVRLEAGETLKGKEVAEVIKTANQQEQLKKAKAAKAKAEAAKAESEDKEYDPRPKELLSVARKRAFEGRVRFACEESGGIAGMRLPGARAQDQAADSEFTEEMADLAHEVAEAWLKVEREVRAIIIKRQGAPTTGRFGLRLKEAV